MTTVEIKAELQIAQTARVDPDRLIETMLRFGWRCVSGPRDPVVILEHAERQLSVPRTTSAPEAERLLTTALYTVAQRADIPVRALLLEVAPDAPGNYTDPLTSAVRTAAQAGLDQALPPHLISILIRGVFFAHMERDVLDIIERERAARFVEATAARLERLRCFTDDERFLLRDCVDDIRRTSALVRRRSAREELLVLDELAEAATTVTSAAWGVGPEPWSDKTDTGWREQWRAKVRGWLTKGGLPEDTRDAAAAVAVRLLARALGYKPAAPPS